MSVYETIRAALDIEDVAERYGVEVRRGKARCPFHSDGTPSMSFKDGRFKCFGCGEGGDAVDFVAKIYGESMHEAAARLNRDYGLGLDLDAKPSQRERTDLLRRKQLRDAWKVRAEEISSAMRLYREMRMSKYGWMDATAEHVIGLWEYSSDEERPTIYKEWGETIGRIQRDARGAGR